MEQWMEIWEGSHRSYTLLEIKNSFAAEVGLEKIQKQSIEIFDTHKARRGIGQDSKLAELESRMWTSTIGILVLLILSRYCFPVIANKTMLKTEICPGQEIRKNKKKLNELLDMLKTVQSSALRPNKCPHATIYLISHFYGRMTALCLPHIDLERN